MATETQNEVMPLVEVGFEDLQDGRCYWFVVGDGLIRDVVCEFEGDYERLQEVGLRSTQRFHEKANIESKLAKGECRIYEVHKHF